jgi:hypothetical protein
MEYLLRAERHATFKRITARAVTIFPTIERALQSGSRTEWPGVQTVFIPHETEGGESIGVASFRS